MAIVVLFLGILNIPILQPVFIADRQSIVVRRVALVTIVVVVVVACFN